MLSNEDIVKLAKLLATKQDIEALATKDELYGIKNDVMNKVDSVYKEVLAMRQEQSVHQNDHDDMHREIEEIKSVPAIAHQIKR